MTYLCDDCRKNKSKDRKITHHVPGKPTIHLVECAFAGTLKPHIKKRNECDFYESESEEE